LLQQGYIKGRAVIVPSLIQLEMDIWNDSRRGYPAQKNTSALGWL
jgi:hypothetical protein